MTISPTNNVPDRMKNKRTLTIKKAFLFCRIALYSVQQKKLRRLFRQVLALMMLLNSQISSHKRQTLKQKKKQGAARSGKRLNPNPTYRSVRLIVIFFVACFSPPKFHVGDSFSCTLFSIGVCVSGTQTKQGEQEKKQRREKQEEPKWKKVRFG